MNDHDIAGMIDGLEPVSHRILPQFSADNHLHNLIEFIRFEDLFLDQRQVLLVNHKIDAVDGPAFLKDLQGMDNDRLVLDKQELLVRGGTHSLSRTAGKDDSNCSHFIFTLVLPVEIRPGT